jgi:hypothetical protein
MGYSTPKKQLDLKEFLSQPAKKLPRKLTFGSRSRMNPVDRLEDTAEAPAENTEPDGMR